MRIAPVAVAHGNISVSIKTENEAVPAVPFTDGELVVQTNQTIEVNEEKLDRGRGGKSFRCGRRIESTGHNTTRFDYDSASDQKAGALRASIEVM